MTVGYAQANHLRTLARPGQGGADADHRRPAAVQQGTPGLPTIERPTASRPRRSSTLAVGDQYAALNDGTVQAADVSTTDGQLASGDYRVLGDPGNAVRLGQRRPGRPDQGAAAEGPAFADTIDRSTRS